MKIVRPEIFVGFEDWAKSEHKEPVATHVDMWYNPHIRLWELTPMDDENNQVGDTVYEYGKKGAVLRKKEMENDLVSYSRYY